MFIQNRRDSISGGPSSSCAVGKATLGKGQIRAIIFFYTKHVIKVETCLDAQQFKASTGLSSLTNITYSKHRIICKLVIKRL